MREAVIVSYARTGLAKAARGGFNHTPAMSMAAHAVKHAVGAPCYQGSALVSRKDRPVPFFDDVVRGARPESAACLMKEIR